MATSTLIDLFAGVGGLSEGFLQSNVGSAKWDLLLATDVDQEMKGTHERNRPRVPFFVADIRKTKSKDFLKEANCQPGDVDLIVGGPPCQGFSMAGNRFVDDDRNKLFLDFVRIVKGVKPRAVLMENVPQILTLWDGRFGHEILQLFKKLGYIMSAKVLQASDYGVPQIRRRAFFLGLARSEFPAAQASFPFPSHRPVRNILRLMRGLGHDHEVQPTLDHFEDPVLVEEAIGDLPPLKAGEGSQVSDYTMPAFTPYQAARRKHSKKLYNHQAWGHTQELLAYVKMIPEGGRMLDDVPEEKWKGRAFSQAYARLHRKGIAYTITTYIHNPGSGRFLHYRDQRAITIREAARLQSFDDDFVFVGHLVSQEKQVGNAVPPILSRALANHISAHYFGGSKEMPEQIVVSSS